MRVRVCVKERYREKEWERMCVFERVSVLCISTNKQLLLCILTGFWVLCEPESWLKYFDGPLSDIISSFSPFSSFLSESEQIVLATP